jgi:large subunit ribosomal protein L18
MKRIDDKLKRRVRRKKHIRKRLMGTSECPRMTVYRSNKHMYVQIIDDNAGETLLSVSSLQKDLSSLKNCVGDAEKLGEAVGDRLKKKKIGRVVFDRNGYRYHGIIKAIADGTRSKGIEF